MATMTTDQLADIRGEIGGDTTWADSVFNRFYTRADSDYSLTVVYALRRKWAEASKYHTYTVGGDAVNKNQIFQNIEKMLKHWEKVAGVEGGELSSGVMSLGLDFTEDDLTEWESL